MSGLRLERCFNHPGREAAARCPQCSRPYCRECVTEHDDRVICSRCLEELVTRRASRRRVLAVPYRVGQCALALCIAWAAFNSIGRLLLLIPARFHDGTYLGSLGGEDGP